VLSTVKTFGTRIWRYRQPLFYVALFRGRRIEAQKKRKLAAFVECLRPRLFFMSAVLGGLIVEARAHQPDCSTTERSHCSGVQNRFAGWAPDQADNNTNATHG
jgi:hypothetical protein